MIKKNRFLQFVMIIVYKLLYDIVVLQCLPNIYMHELTYDKNYSATGAILGWVAFLAVIFITQKSIILMDSSNPVKLCILFLFYMYYIPLNSAFYMNDLTFGFLIITSIYWIIFVSLPNIQFGGHKIYQINMQEDNFKQGEVFDTAVVYAVLIIINLACIFYTIKYNGFRLSLNIWNVYDVRASFSGTTSIFESVLFNFGGSLMVGISMIFALDRKRYVLFTTGLLAQLGIFSIAGQKGQLFSVLIVVGAYVLKKWNLLRKIHIIIPFGLLIMHVIALCEKIIFHTTYIFTLFIRRLFYIPAWINGLYYDFFSQHKLLLFSQDVFLINRLGINRYSESVLQIINKNYFGGYVESPNTGLFAEAFMHFGYVGVIAFPFITIYIISKVFKYSSCYSQSVQFLILVEITLSLINLPVTSGIFCVTYLPLIPVTYALIRLRINK